MPGEECRPPESVVREGLKLSSDDAVQLPTGGLTLQQLVSIFSTLPVDLTFVDADDRVAFFSEGPDLGRSWLVAARLAALLRRRRLLLGAMAVSPGPKEPRFTVRAILDSGAKTIAA